MGQTSASGASGLYAAVQTVASGASDVTLLVGGERMTHRTTADATDIIASVTHPAEYKHGVTLPSFAGLPARLYLDRDDVPREALAAVPVKNHANATEHPNAQFHTDIDVEDVVESPLVADPLRLYDFCPVTDGSAALLVTTEAVAREYADEYVGVTGIGAATDTHVVHQRDDPLAMHGTARSSDTAFERSGRTPADVDVAELHDMVSILEVLQLEALGFADRGTAWRAAAEGRTTLDGPLAVNPSGGLKARGHPLGATGVAQGRTLPPTDRGGGVPSGRRRRRPGVERRRVRQLRRHDRHGGSIGMEHTVRSTHRSRTAADGRGGDRR